MREIDICETRRRREGGEMAFRVELEVTDGPDSVLGRRFAFAGPRAVVVGRDPGCEVCVPGDPQAARRHFLLDLDPPDAFLIDLGSGRGTFVNGVRFDGEKGGAERERGRPVPAVALSDGDRVRAGATTFAVHRDDCPTTRRIAPAAERPLPPAPSSAPPDRGGLARGLSEELPGLDGFEVLAKLGEGGAGAVFLVRDPRGERAALKVLLARVAMQEAGRRRFLREVELLRKVSRERPHENVIPLISHGAAGDLFYLLMEYADGGSVADLLHREGGSLPPSRAVPIALQALAGLSHVHHCLIVHRDVKPGNILLQSSAGRQVARLTDLGLAKLFEGAGLTGLTTTGELGGTMRFMPPEQITGYRDVRESTDIWSMGATLYHMLTGAFPFEFTAGRDEIRVILSGAVVPIRERDPLLPRHLAAAIDRAVNPRVEERPRSAAEFRRELVRACVEDGL